MKNHHSLMSLVFNSVVKIALIARSHLHASLATSEILLKQASQVR